MILCVGELLWDVHVEPGASLETGEQLRRVPGGAAGNVAAALASRGLPAAVAGSLSDDALGRGLAAALEQAGVDTTRIAHGPGRTGLVFLERTRAVGERFVAYRPTVEAFRGCALPGHLHALHVAAINPDDDELEALATMAEQARERAAWVLVDVNARPLPWKNPVAPPARASIARLFRAAHAIKVSDADLTTLQGRLPDARDLLGAGAATLLVTRGAASTEARGPWGTLDRMPPPVTVRRSVGAGDAFCAGLLAAMSGRTPEVSRSPAFWSEALDAAQASAAERIGRIW